MRRRSKRGARRDRVYRMARIPWLEGHPWCEIRSPRCTGRSTEIHHVVKRSQSVELQNDRRNWCAACFACNQYVEAEPRWALHRGVWIRGGVTIPEYVPSPMLSTTGVPLVELPEDHPWSIMHGTTTFGEPWVMAVCARWADSSSIEDEMEIRPRNGVPSDVRWANLIVEGFHSA